MAAAAPGEPRAEPARAAAPSGAPPARHPVLIRLTVAPLLLALLGGLAWIHVATGNALSTDLLLGLLGGVAGGEMARLLSRAAPAAPHARAHLLVAVLACFLLGGVGLLAPEPGAARHLVRLLVPVGAFLVLLALHAADTAPASVDAIARALLPVVYVGLLFTWMRDLADPPHGAERLLWVALTAKASDIGGWLVGKPFGRHKLVPRISPGKSWEGLVGGVAASAAVAVLLAGPLGTVEAAWSAPAQAAFGGALALASIAAGITQSGWKRRLGAKDSSRLIPEMGGVLDMLDSLLLAGPLAVLWIALAG